MAGSIKDLSRYRFEESQEILTDARIMFENGRYKNTLNRAYYSIFHAIRAVIALAGFDSSKHSGVISFFTRNYVKTGFFSKEMSKIIQSAAENREKADYLDFFVASRKEAERQIAQAEIFTKTIEEYLVEKGVLEKTKPNS